MRKTLLTLFAVFANFALGMLGFFAAGSVIMELLISGGGLLGAVAVVLAFSVLVGLVNLVFMKLLKTSLLRQTAIALPPLLCGIAVFFLFYLLQG